MSRARSIRLAVGESFQWVTRRETFSTVVERTCPLCNAAAIVKLPTPLLAKQPDETTHVCHPTLGGCNHGFAATAVAKSSATVAAAWWFTGEGDA